MTWTIAGKRITTPSGAVITLDLEVADAVEVGDVLVVVLNVPKDQVMTENVYGITRDGNILWKIERTPETATDPVNVYVGAKQQDSNSVRVANWNGVVVTVDVKTGRITHSEWLK